MPIRWVINPVIETIVDGTTYRKAKVASLLDAGRVGKYYRCVSHIYDGATWCLTFVRGANFLTLDADPEVINLLERDYEDADDVLSKTPRQLGFPGAKLQRIRARLEAKGVDTTGLTVDSTLAEILERLGNKIQAGCNPRGLWYRGTDLS